MGPSAGRGSARFFEDSALAAARWAASPVPHALVLRASKTSTKWNASFFLKKRPVVRIRSSRSALAQQQSQRRGGKSRMTVPGEAVNGRALVGESGLPHDDERSKPVSILV